MKKIVVILFLAVVSWQCAKHKPGTPFVNQSPETWFVNVSPPDSTTGKDAPVFYWMGSDKDGRVIGYEYVIDDITKAWTFLPCDSGMATQDTVQFSAPNLTGDWHTLYIRAVDDKWAKDPTPPSQTYNATTIAPNTIITGGPILDDISGLDTVFCLPATTTTWPGVLFTVFPADTMDPDGRVVGWYYAIDDSLPKPTWSYTTKCTISVMNLSDGVHTIYVNARDNADAIDPTSAKRSFFTVTPTFENGILLVDETKPDPFNRNAPEATTDGFYNLILSGHPYIEWENSQGTTPPRAADFSHYRLVIWHSDDNFPSIDKDKQVLEDYLKVGGKFWLTGFRPLCNLLGLTSTEDPDTTLASGDFLYDFFGVKTVLTNTARDFVGTQPTFSGFLPLQVDSLKLLPSYLGKIPKINIMPEIVGSGQNLANFISSSSDPNFQGKPCAIFYQGATFKTVLFTFPLYQMAADVNGEPVRSFVGKILTDYLGE